jgi:hypothetical protein
MRRSIYTSTSTLVRLRHGSGRRPCIGARTYRTSVASSLLTQALLLKLKNACQVRCERGQQALMAWQEALPLKPPKREAYNGQQAQAEVSALLTPRSWQRYAPVSWAQRVCGGPGGRVPGRCRASRSSPTLARAGTAGISRSTASTGTGLYTWSVDKREESGVLRVRQRVPL